MLRAHGDTAAAADTLAEVLALEPDSVTANVALGEVLLDLRQPDRAIHLFNAAIRSSNGASHEAYRGAAKAALRAGHLQPGLQLIQQALRVRPDDPESMIVHGRLLRRTGRPKQALPWFEKALRAAPENVDALLGAAELLQASPRQNDSIEYFDKVVSIEPGSARALIFSAAGRIVTTRIDEEDVSRARLLAFLSVDAPVELSFKAAYWAPFLGMPRDVERRCWDKIGATIDADIRAHQRTPFVHGRVRHERIRIGYVSPNFGDHSIGHVTAQIYGLHDRSRFEVFIYPTHQRPRDDSEFKTRIMQSCDHYTPMNGMTPAQMAQRFDADGIDILVDLNGYMGAANIVQAFALKPAPLQLYWLGHGGTLGLPYYDYVVGDPVVTPDADDHHHVEKIMRMPHCFAPAAAHPIGDETLTRAHEGLSEHATVFCSFNNPAKIDSTVFAAWMAILKAVPDSQLWVSIARASVSAENLKRLAAASGIAESRLVFATRVDDKAQHFARHRLADLFLDTFHVNAATTCLDALWGGVPLLTRPGEHFCSRIAASMLHVAGLDDLIVASTDAYIAKAIELANDPAQLAAFRERIAVATRQSPLFDTARYVRTFESGLIKIWERWQQGLPPVGLSLTERI